MTAPVDIYVRVSRRAGRTDERFHSPEEQEQIARAYAKARGLKVGVVLTPDIDRSGGTVEREGLRQALSRIRAGESQGFVVAWIDRFSRDAAQAYDLLREIDNAGGRVYAPEAPEDVSSPEGELQLGMFLLIAQYQRKRARAGFQRAKERATLNGIPVGPPPTGYRLRPDRTLEPDPVVAPLVRELYERRASGETHTPLANFMRDATGHPWTLSGVAKVLRNRIYATGRLEYAGVVAEVATEPLVDEALWHAVQGTTPRPRPARSTAAGWLLTGLLRCDACGKALSPKLGARGRKVRDGYAILPPERRQRRYYCRNRACTDRANVDAPRLEEWVKLHSFEAGEHLATRSEAPDLGTLEDAMVAAERRLTQVLAPESQDALGDAWPATARARRQERDAAAAALGEARQAAGPVAVDFRLREVWGGLSPEDRRAALAMLWKVIRVGRPNGNGTPLTFVARGPLAQAEVDLPG